MKQPFLLLLLWLVFADLQAIEATLIQKLAPVIAPYPQQKLIFDPAMMDCETRAAVNVSDYPIVLDPHDITKKASLQLGDKLYHQTLPYWSSEPIGYILNKDQQQYSFETADCMRDVEVTTWVADGMVILRKNALGEGIFFAFKLDQSRQQGSLQIGIIKYAKHNPLQSKRYILYHNADLPQVLNYDITASAKDFFTVGVSGFDIYARFGQREIVRIKDFRIMAPGKVAAWSNRYYGFKRTTIQPLSAKPLFSDYQQGFLDLRDFGLRDVSFTADIAAGSNQLLLTKPTDLVVGDGVIVETGAEYQPATINKIGVGGIWPVLHYANKMQLDQDHSQPDNTHARLDNGAVYFYAKSHWHLRPKSQYYLHQSFARALSARIEKISSDGRILYLSKKAQADVRSGTVHFDNYYPFHRVAVTTIYPHDAALIDQKYRVHTPLSKITNPQTLVLPEGHYAFSQALNIAFPRWKLWGQGAEKSRLYAPKGVANALIRVTADQCEVRNLHLQGNLADQGYGLAVGMSSFDPQNSWDSGVNFQRLVDGIATDLVVSNVWKTAVGTDWAHHVWASRIHSKTTEPIKMYIGWLYGWSSSHGGGCLQCDLTSQTLIPGYETFLGQQNQFIGARSINGLLAVNAGNDFIFKDFDVILQANSLATFSPQTPMISINTNIIPEQKRDQQLLAKLKQGGLLQNIRLIQQGYINPKNDVLFGIVIGPHNPNIRLRNIDYQAPDYQLGSQSHGAVALVSNQTSTDISGFRVLGRSKTNDFTYASFTMTGGSLDHCFGWTGRFSKNTQIKNCQIETIRLH